MNGWLKYSYMYCVPQSIKTQEERKKERKKERKLKSGKSLEQMNLFKQTKKKEKGSERRKRDGKIDKIKEAF